MFLPRGQLNWLGADELHHVLRRTPRVHVESQRSSAGDSERELFLCVVQRREPPVDQQRIDARVACTLGALVRGEGSRLNADGSSRSASTRRRTRGDATTDWGRRSRR